MTLQACENLSRVNALRASAQACGHEGKRKSGFAPALSVLLSFAAFLRFTGRGVAHTWSSLACAQPPTLFNASAPRLSSRLRSGSAPAPLPRALNIRRLESWPLSMPLAGVKLRLRSLQIRLRLRPQLSGSAPASASPGSLLAARTRPRHQVCPIKNRTQSLHIWELPDRVGRSFKAGLPRAMSRLFRPRARRLRQSALRARAELHAIHWLAGDQIDLWPHQIDSPSCTPRMRRACKRQK